MMRAARRPCPLCGHGEVRVLHALRFALAAESPLPRAYDIAACARCEFVFADTPGSTADYARYYAQHSHYVDPAIATGGGDSAADRRRLEEIAAWLAQRVRAGASVLDIGCGNGGLLEALRSHGFVRLAGIDPAAGCVARLQARGLRAWQGALGALPETGERHDLVILSHVLEHLLEPRAALAEVRARLAPAGRVFVETPDASRYAGREFVPFYFFDSEHINHFDGESQAALGARCGYALEAAAETDLIAGGRPYPVVRSLLAPAATATAVPPLGRLRPAIERYIAESRRGASDPSLAALVASGRPLALWGAGSFAQRLLGEGPLAGARFMAVVDRDSGKHGQSLAGCRIAPPEALQALPAGTVVVVAAALAAPAIVAECRAMGLDCHVPAAGRAR